MPQNYPGCSFGGSYPRHIVSNGDASSWGYLWMALAGEYSQTHSRMVSEMRSYLWIIGILFFFFSAISTSNTKTMIEAQARIEISNALAAKFVIMSLQELQEEKI